MRYLQKLEFKTDVLPDPTAIEEDYLVWVHNEQFLLLQKERPGQKSLFRQLHAAKRGDSYYVERTERRFDCKIAHIPDYEYFSIRDRGIKKTDLIFITLTYADQNYQNWIDNGKDFQQFANRMRSTYGKIEFIRVWESHASGYPHIHVLMRLSHDVFCRRINRQWRIIGKNYKQIRGYWTKGFSDMVALNGTHQVVRYLKKYVTKAVDGENGKHVRTLAMLWFFNKRAFSISKRLFEDLKCGAAADLIIRLHNSYENGLPWTYVGVFSGEMCEKLIKEIWELELWHLRGGLPGQTHQNAGLETFIC